MSVEDLIYYYECQRDAIKKALGGGQKLTTYRLKRDLILHHDPTFRKGTLRLIKLRSKYDDVLATLGVLNRSKDRMEIFTESEEVILENLSDVPGDSQDVQGGKNPQSHIEGQDNALSMDDFLRRPIRIYDGSLALNTDVNLRLSVWDLLTSVPSIRAKLRNYAYFRGNLHVRTTVSGTPFHFGRLLQSYQPYADYNINITEHLVGMSDPAWRPLFLNYLSQSKESATININENKPLEMIIPFISPKPMFRLFNASASAIAAGTAFEDMEHAGDLFIYSINQPRAVAAGSTALYIQVYAWMEDVGFGTSTATQLAITTEAGRDEREVGPVESMASGATAIATALIVVPQISFWAKASAIGFGLLTMIAAHFGWSKPTPIAAPVVVKQEPFQNGANTIGYDTNKRIVLDPKQELTIDPRVAATSDDEMSITYLAQRPTYFLTTTWDDSDAIMGTPIEVINVTPSIGTALVTGATTAIIQPTALCLSAAPFLYWRGDITFRFEIVCSNFHRGKLAVIYEPNVSQQAIINTSFEYNKQYIQIIDIQETRNFEVTVRWAGYRPWYYVTNAHDVIENSGGDYVVPDPGVTNGYIAITPFTALQSPDGSAVYINHYVFSRDIRYNQLTYLNLPRGREHAPEFKEEEDAPLPVIETEAAIMAATGSTALNDDTLSFDINTSTADVSHISEDYFGEQPASFRALLKRYVTNLTRTYAARATAATRMLFIDPIIPQNNLTYGTATTGIPDLWMHLQYAYLGMRGGIRKRLHLSSDVHEGAATHAKIGRRSPATTSAVGTYLILADTTASTLEGVCSYVPSTSGGFEAEFPFYTNNAFFFSFADNPIQGASTNEMTDLYSIDHTFDIETSGTYAAGIMSLEVAIAEDFTFLRFQGAPFYSTV